jgi:hypothetical protein
MFAFECYRPPTKSCERASQSHRKLCTYLQSSGDATDVFLETALAKVRENAALWAVAQGNSTSSHSEICFSAQACAALEHLLVSLSQSPGNASTGRAFAEVASCLRISGRGSRLEKVVKEVSERASAKQSNVTASSGNQVIVS